jgi:hypothetical protein
MGKTVHDNVLDAALDHIRAKVKLITACTTQPSTYASGTSTTNAEVARCTGVTSAGTYFGAPANATGSGGGRTLTVQQLTTTEGTSITAGGTANHIALMSAATASNILYITTCTSQALTTGNDITFNSWDITIEDPT